MNNHRLKPQITQIILLATCYLLLATLVGCEAFVRKFTLKPKKSTIKEQPILIPEEYPVSRVSTETRYRQYFLFWKSWHEELIAELSSFGSYKRRKSCLEEAIKNLEKIKTFLFEEKQKDLDVYLEKLRQLESAITKDTHGIRLATHKRKAESLKRNILRDFSYPAVKNHLR